MEQHHAQQTATNGASAPSNGILSTPSVEESQSHAQINGNLAISAGRSTGNVIDYSVAMTVIR